MLKQDKMAVMQQQVVIALNTNGLAARRKDGEVKRVQASNADAKRKGER